MDKATIAKLFAPTGKVFGNNMGMYVYLQITSKIELNTEQRSELRYSRAYKFLLLIEGVRTLVIIEIIVVAEIDIDTVVIFIVYALPGYSYSTYGLLWHHYNIAFIAGICTYIGRYLPLVKYIIDIQKAYITRVGRHISIVLAAYGAARGGIRTRFINHIVTYVFISAEYLAVVTFQSVFTQANTIGAGFQARATNYILATLFFTRRNAEEK